MVSLPHMRWLVVLALVFGACRDNPPVEYPTVAPFDETAVTLGPMDKIDVTVYHGTRSAKAAYVLDAMGDIEVQYLGQVHAAGKTPQALRDELQQKLGDGFLKDPIVSVTVTELNSRKLSVLGQVNKTGTIRFTPGMTITEAIAQSGGFSPMARKNNVQVRRTLNGKLHTYTVAVERIAEGENPNMQLMPGDEVFVPERPW